MGHWRTNYLAPKSSNVRFGPKAERMIKNSYDFSINAYFEWGVVGDKKFKNKEGY